MTVEIPLPNDPALPGLKFAVDGVRVRELARRAGASDVERAQPVYIRWKPATNALVLHRLTPRKDRVCSPFALVRIDSDGKGRRNFLRTGRGAFDREAHAHLMLFPDDPKILCLREVTSPASIAKLLGSGLPFDPLRVRLRIVHYKPGRRAVVRCDVKGPHRESIIVYARGYATGKAKALEDLWRIGVQILAASEVVSPIVLGRSNDILFTSHVAGRRPSVSDAAAIGTALWRVHEVGSNGSERRLHLENLASQARYLASLDPASAEEVTKLAPLIAERAANWHFPTGWTHGDLDPTQILVSRRNIAFLDLDKSGMNHFAKDVARFLAFLRTRGELTWRRNFLASYGDISRGLGNLEAATLLDLAVNPFRHLKPLWPQQLRTILRSARRCLNA